MLALKLLKKVLTQLDLLAQWTIMEGNTEAVESGKYMYIALKNRAPLTKSGSTVRYWTSISVSSMVEIAGSERTFPSMNDPIFSIRNL